MEQYIPKVSEDDIDRIIRRDFPKENFSIIKTMIKQLEIREKSRIVAACLKAANGNLNALKQEFENAPCYWREIISGSEYPNYSKKIFRINKISELEIDALIEKDKVQYLNWFNKQ